jgi:hypothetical protein
MGDFLHGSEETEMFRLDTDVPEAEFPTTICTIAFSGGFLRHVEVCFEFDVAAETTAGVGFERHNEDEVR